MLFELAKRAKQCLWGAPLAIGVLPACLVDLDARCGEHQHYDSAQGVCLCDADAELVGNACVLCAEHEVGSPDGCVCVDGYVRPTATDGCQALAGLGEDCSSDAECGEAEYAYCRLEAGASSGYCTARDCAGGAACPGDYSCNAREAVSFCQRPPSGLGQACSSSDDCAGNEASYCETVVAKSCVVNGCASDPDKCYGDWVCCDIGLLSQSLCVPPSQLEAGNCPAGGTLVPREGS